MHETEAALELQIAADPRCSRDVRKQTLAFARSHGVDDAVSAQFLTALGEAVANAIEHAKTPSPIDVAISLDSERIVAKVHDRGVGFTCDAGEQPALPPGEAERGRGLPIMRRCSDIFTLESAPGRGTTIVLGRYLREPSRHAAGALK